MTIIGFLNVLKRQRWLIACVAVLVAAAFVANELRKPHLYQATAEVVLVDQSGNPLGLNTSLSAEALNSIVATEAEIGSEPALAARTLRATGIRNRTPQQLLDASSVTPSSTLAMLDFSVTDASPTAARTLATAFAIQFPAYLLEFDTTSLKQDEQEVRGRLGQLPQGSADAAIVQSLSAKLDSLASQAALQTTGARLVRTAGEAVQTQPHTLREGVIGLVLGLLAAIALALLRDATDTRARSAREAAETVGLPLLGRIPPVRRRRLLPLAHDRRSQLAQSEAYRILAAQLAVLDRGPKPRVLMATSALRGEGKSTTIANLGIALAQMGRRVVVVDLDLRRPQLHRFFAIPDGPGLSDVAFGTAALADALQAVDHVPSSLSPRPQRRGAHRGGAATIQLPRGALRFLHAGSSSFEPSQLVASSEFAAIFAELRRQAEIILVDTAPFLEASESILLTPVIDEALAIIRLETSRKPLLTELRLSLRMLGVPVLGLVVTDAPPRSLGYGLEERQLETRSVSELLGLPAETGMQPSPR